MKLILPLTALLLTNLLANLSVNLFSSAASAQAGATAEPHALLTCQGMQNNFGRLAPDVELRKSGGGYVLTFTDASGNATASFALEKRQITVTPNESSGLKVEVLGGPQGPARSKKFLTLSFSPTNQKARGVTENSRPHTDAQLLISLDYAPPATHWAGLYRGPETCRLNLAEWNQN